MPTTLAYKFAGKTIGLSVSNSSHTAVTIQTIDPSANAIVICNTSTTVTVYITALSSPTNAALGTAPASTVPTDGAAGSFPVLAYDDTVIAGMSFPISVTAIGDAAGPTLITVTPVTLL